MRRHLLTLLALLVLLMQPAALLHALSHGPGGAHAAAAAAADDAGGSADTNHAHLPSGLDCLQCLAFAAIGSTALPAALLMFRGPLLRHAVPCGASRVRHGGTGAGYHARGPPLLA